MRHSLNILLDISSGPEVVLISKECRSRYVLGQAISGNSRGVGMVDGRFELVVKFNVKQKFYMFALADGDSTV